MSRAPGSTSTDTRHVGSSRALHDGGTSDNLHGLRSDQHLAGCAACCSRAATEIAGPLAEREPVTFDTTSPVSSGSKLTGSGQSENPLSGLVGG